MAPQPATSIMPPANTACKAICPVIKWNYALETKTHLEGNTADGALGGTNQFHGQHKPANVGAGRAHDAQHKARREHRKVFGYKCNSHAHNQLQQSRPTEDGLAPNLVGQATQGNCSREHAQHEHGLNDRAHPTTIANEIPIDGARGLVICCIIHILLAGNQAAIASRLIVHVAWVQLAGFLCGNGGQNVAWVPRHLRKAAVIQARNVASMLWYGRHCNQGEHVQACCQGREQLQEELGELVLAKLAWSKDEGESLVGR